MFKCAMILIGSDKTVNKSRMQNGEAKTDIRDNDTSVTRGSVTKKTERLDSYEFARTQMPFEFPSQGVLRTSIDY